MELRAFLQRSLPDYMVPALFMMLPQFPLTPNGKLDRKALPQPQGERPSLASVYVAPRNAIETTIVEIWQKILPVDEIGVNDNFFDLGGHSLLIAQVHQALQTAFSRPLSLVDMFSYPTVSDLAGYFSQAEPEPVVTRVDNSKREAGKHRLKQQLARRRATKEKRL